jgi:hypothetical protein
MSQAIYTLASANTDVTPVNPTYTVNQVYLTIKTIDLANSSYYSDLKSEIEASGGISVPWKHWTSQPGNQTAAGSLAQTTRLTVNGSSINKVVATFVPNDYAAGTNFPASPAIATAAAAASVAAAGTYGNSGVSRYFQRGTASNAADFSSLFTINNVQIGGPASMAQVWYDNREAWNLGASSKTGLNPLLTNLSDFSKAFFAHTLRLNMNTDEDTPDNVRVLGGLDSRESTVTVLHTSAGTTDVAGMQVTPVLWVEQTSVLRVGSGRSLNVVG